MIYIYKKDGFIYITDKPRQVNKDSDDYISESELLYVKESWNSLENIYKNLRYYKVLWKPEDGWFKNCHEVLRYISLELPEEINPILSFVYTKDIDKTISDFQETLKYLISVKILGEIFQPIDLNNYINYITYKCDIINILEDVYGEHVVKVVRGFQKLPEIKKQFLINFYKLETRDKKLDYLKANINRIGSEGLQNYLPSLYNLSNRLFKVHPKERDTLDENCPEFNNSSRLDGKSKIIDNQDYFVRQDIYKIFTLGEIWEGGKIKEELGKIYEKYNVQKNSRVHDIFNYFDTSITRKGYRLNTRKI